MRPAAGRCCGSRWAVLIRRQQRHSSGLRALLLFLLFAGAFLQPTTAPGNPGCVPAADELGSGPPLHAQLQQQRRIARGRASSVVSGVTFLLKTFVADFQLQYLFNNQMFLQLLKYLNQRIGWNAKLMIFSESILLDILI